VDEYLIDLNATQAAIRAGYGQRSAYSIGQWNLRKPEIQAASGGETLQKSGQIWSGGESDRNHWTGSAW
jgi:phage terminase small subunit